MPLNLNALRLFDAVARTGSVTRAAGVARVSQPAISKAVRELERGLGVALLERGARGVRLTEAGALLAERANALFGLARSTEEEMAAFRGLAAGTLRVGASTTVATYYLPRLLAEFTRRHPSVAVRLTSANTAEIARRLAAYEVDVALVEGPVAEARIVTQAWRADGLVLLAGAGHRLAGRRVAWREIERELLLLREPGSGTRDVVLRALSAAGLAPGRTLELGSTEAIKQAVAAGLGVGFVPRAAAADQLALGTVAVIGVRGLDVARELTRLSLAGRRESAAARAFARVLAEASETAARRTRGA